MPAAIDALAPDVLCLQEAWFPFQRDDLEAGLEHRLPYASYGGGGVALLSRQEPLTLHKGFPGDAEDAQRRFIYGTFADAQANPVTVMNGYFPQGESRDHPTKFPAKQRFYADLQNLLLSQFSPEQALVVMGDINISPEDCDIGIGEP
ncbi:MAG: exodeoxyribonuclease III, partial [Gammaproteobacteria bacterium HGW-Gammaproteobacteria-7]